MAPISAPMPEQRSTSQGFFNTSRTPWTQPLPSALRLAMAPPPRSRSNNSGSAKMPRPTMTSGSPSLRYSVPKSIRYSPVAGAAPIIPKARPRQAEATPLPRLPPDSAATVDRPNSVSMNNSAEPNSRMMGRAATTAPVSTMAPNSPPSIEAKKAAESARAAWPSLASGKPSSTVAWEADEPGMPISTEEKVSEVGITATRPISMASAEVWSMP